MRIRGIHYDVGIDALAGGLTRPSLEQSEIERDLDLIADELHANAVRITGRDPARLALAAGLAADRGLAVWLSPMLVNGTPEETLAVVERSAEVGADLERHGHSVVVVVGCEWSTFMAGVLPGDDVSERFALLSDPTRLMAAIAASGLDPQARMTDILRAAVEAVRARFGGPVTYAAGAWEHVDWSGLDVVGIDAYRDAGNREAFADSLTARIQPGKPVVVTESGCATFRGASDLGGLAWTALDRSSRPPHLNPGIERDEAAQATEVGALLDVFEGTGVDGAFVYTLIAPTYAGDLDAASYALVHSLGDGTIRRKAAFEAVAERYGQTSER